MKSDMCLFSSCQTKSSGQKTKNRTTKPLDCHCNSPRQACETQMRSSSFLNFARCCMKRPSSFGNLGNVKLSHLWHTYEHRASTITKSSKCLLVFAFTFITEDLSKVCSYLYNVKKRTAKKNSTVSSVLQDIGYEAHLFIALRRSTQSVGLARSWLRF